MGRKRIWDADAVLDAFARNLPLAEISRSLGGVPIGTLGAIIHRARRAGDPRAVLRRRLTPRPAPTTNVAPSRASARHRRRQLARAFPSTPVELNEAIARTTVKPRRLRAAPATWGWRPSWLRI